MKLNTIIILFLSSPLVLISSPLVIEDFSEYTSDATLRDNWQGLGAAAVVAQPTFRENEGVGGSNAMRVVVDWSSNTNGTARHNNISNLDLTSFSSITTVVRIEDRGGSFDPPTQDTIMLLGIEGANGAIWRTTSVAGLVVNNNAYQTYEFKLDEIDMQRVQGGGSLTGALEDVVTVRLRFENPSENNSRQDIFVDNITAIPEPQIAALLLGFVGVLVIFYHKFK